MGALLIRAGLAFACSLAVACGPPAAAGNSGQAPAAEKVTDQASFGQQKLVLVERGGRCLLRGNATFGEQPLAPTAPCYFMRSRGKLKQFSYPEVNVQSVAVVIGSLVTDDAERRDLSLSQTGVCGTVAQGLILRDGAVRIAPDLSQGGVACRDGGFDEKNFYGFAHDYAKRAGAQSR